MNEFLLGIPGKLTSIISSLSTLLGRVTGNVDVNVSSRAPASTAVSNAVWTDALANKLGRGALNASPTADIASGGAVSTYLNQVVSPIYSTNNVTTSSTSMTDVVNITGSGYVTALFMKSSISDPGVVELIIDGVTVVSRYITSNYMVSAVGWFDAYIYWDGSSVKTGYKCLESPPVYFNSSLVIRHRKTSSTTSAQQELFYRYVKT